VAGNNGRSPGEDKSGRRNGKRFVRKKRRFGSTAKATLFEKKLFKETRLANAGAGEPAVVFHAHLAAAEQIGDGRDGFLCVFRAGTHRQDEIAK
jgi:hypothetical protein